MLNNKKFLIFGLGRSGRAVLDFLYKNKAAIVCVDDYIDSDKLKTLSKEYKGVSFFSSDFPDSILDDIDIVVLSPGISLSHPLVQLAKAKRIEIIGEIELAYRYKREGYIIAITGTNGKTTTATLIEEILKKSGKNVILAGNIGVPFISVINKDYEYIVLEISSFQLETIDAFHPNMVVFLNISEDHLDRHGDFNLYFNAKKRIFKNQCKEDISILNQDDKNVINIKNTLPSKIYLFGREKLYKNTYAFIKDNKIIITSQEKMEIHLENLKSDSLPFIYNVMAGALATSLLSVPNHVVCKIVYNFSPLPHRMEEIENINGIKFINDSKATNPDAVFWALSSLKKGIVLIMGGKDKNLSFKKLQPLLKEKVKSIILIGEAREKIAKELGFSPVIFAENMQEAVNLAHQNASFGDIVLLSPGCTSWDMYKDYKERGRDFKIQVERLVESEGKRT